MFACTRPCRQRARFQLSRPRHLGSCHPATCAVLPAEQGQHPGLLAARLGGTRGPAYGGATELGSCFRQVGGLDGGHGSSSSSRSQHRSSRGCMLRACALTCSQCMPQHPPAFASMACCSGLLAGCTPPPSAVQGGSGSPSPFTAAAYISSSSHTACFTPARAHHASSMALIELKARSLA